MSYRVCNCGHSEFDHHFDSPCSECHCENFHSSAPSKEDKRLAHLEAIRSQREAIAGILFDDGVSGKYRDQDLAKADQILKRLDVEVKDG